MGQKIIKRTDIVEPLDVIEVATYTSLPVTGVSERIYITQDTNIPYRWDGVAYVSLAGAGGGVETVTGTAVDNTDPLNPVVNSTVQGLQAVLAVGNGVSDDYINIGISATGIESFLYGDHLTINDPSDYGNSTVTSYSVSVKTSTATEEYIQMSEGFLGYRKDGSWQTRLRFQQPTLNGDADITFPNRTATAVLSVNDVLADTNGNITIATGGSTAFINILYADLVTAIAGNTLTVGSWYKITDYQTVHTIPHTTDTNYGTTEPLIIQAIKTNKLAPVAYSETYPQDIIYYNVENDIVKVVGCTKGWISRRIDTDYQNDIAFDFRAVKFRRYASNVATVYNAGTTYTRFDYVINGTGDIYRSVQLSNTGHALTDMDWWVETGNNNADFINPVSGVNVNTASYTDYPLFDLTTYNSGLIVNNTFKYYDCSGFSPYSDILSSQNNVFIETEVSGNRIDTPKFYENHFRDGSITNTRIDANGKFFSNKMRYGWFIENAIITSNSYFSNNIFCGGSLFNCTISNNSGISSSMWYYGDIEDILITASSDISRNVMTGSIYSSIFNTSYMYDCTWRIGMARCTYTATTFNNIKPPTSGNVWIEKTSFLGVIINTNTINLSSSIYAKNVFSRADGTALYSYVNNSNVQVIGAY